MSLVKKIICTLGPSSLNSRVIKRLSELEVHLFRLNLSHTPLNRLEEYVELIKSNSNIPICFDSQGAQIRTGNLVGGQIKLEHGSVVTLDNSTDVKKGFNLPLYPVACLSKLEVGDLISLDFDTALIQVIEKKPVCKARVVCSGFVGSNKAVSIVDHTLSLPSLSEIDVEAFDIAKNLGIKNIALSFTNNSSDVEKLRAIMGKEVTIIAKIESRLGIENLKDIINVTDEILIDRGDLSREVAIESIPYVQKHIIKMANSNNISVHVATNLLESMVKNTKPTRAEVNDIINTLTDGADGLVLAAETAVGKHPVACVSMIKSLLYRFENPINIPSPNYWHAHSNLIDPHGGKLVQNIIEDFSNNDVDKLPKWEVDEYTMIDAAQIALGVFSPITGFLNRDDLGCVLEKNRLCNGDIWTLPIIMQVGNKTKFPFHKDDTIIIETKKQKRAILTIDDVYKYDLDKLAHGYYGTNDSKHPGIKRLYENGNIFVSGRVSLLKEDLQKRRPYELTPNQSRMIFQNQQWIRIVGFHTRNVPHMGHEYLQFTAMEKYDCDGLFIHPVIGPKKIGDFTGDIILKTYRQLIENKYPENKVVLGGFNNYSRYAGPKEAVFTALCRKNFGCSHFIVGRDHTGVGDFYPKDGAKRLFMELGEIGIQPIFFDEVYYCTKCNKYVEKCMHGLNKNSRISGSEVRHKLQKGESLPDWFIRESVLKQINEEINNGYPVLYK